MKYVYKEIRNGTNVSPVNHLKDFFILIGAVLSAFLLFIFCAGFFTEEIVNNIPEIYEKQLVSIISKELNKNNQFGELIDHPHERKVKFVFNKIVKTSKIDHLPLEIDIVSYEVPNAMAFIDGKVLVSDSLLSIIDSENELAMVLAHEIGHYAHRHHLKSIGRLVILLFTGMIFFGQDPSLSEFTLGLLQSSHLSFGRSQEIEADHYALKILDKLYGHTNGSEDFFAKLQEYQGNNNSLYDEYNNTHPSNFNRIGSMKKYIRKNNFSYKGTLKSFP